MANSLASGQKPTGVADLDSSQTLENKTLDSTSTVNGSDVIAASIQSPVRADVKKDTLANLQTYALTASNGQLCFATDAKKMYQVLDAALAEVGSGQGGINYISNPDFELNVDGYTSDVNLTIARSTVAPLRGSASGVISKAAVDASGEVVKIPFTIESADLAKKLYISFDKDASDANYADGDLRVEVIKDPNGTPVTIRCNAEDILGGKGTHLAWFQSDASILEYELVFKCNSANSSAYSVKIDNVQVGPREAVVGTSIDRSYYHIQQDGINMTDKSGEIEYALGSATINSEGNGITAEDDSSNTRTKWIFNSKGNVNVFVGYRTANINDSVQLLHYNSSGTLLNTLTGTKEGVSDGRQSSTFFLKVETKDFITINTTVGVRNTANQCVVSISHDSTASVLMSEDIGNREIRVRGAGNGGTAITANVTDITFTEVEDTANSWNGTQFTTPETGDYDISGSISTDSGAAKSVYAYIGGVSTQSLGTGSETAVPFAGKIRLIKDQVLSIRSDGSFNLNNNSTLHHIHIQKLAQPQTLLETETVAARYTSNSGQSIGTTVGTIVYEDLDFDTHNAYNTSTGEYTVPATGIYHIDAKILSNGDSIVVNGEGSAIFIYVNGVSKTFFRFPAESTTVINHYAGGSDKLRLNKGDVLTIRASQSTASTLVTIAESNTFSIARIK